MPGAMPPPGPQAGPPQGPPSDKPDFGPEQLNQLHDLLQQFAQAGGPPAAEILSHFEDVANQMMGGKPEPKNAPGAAPMEAGNADVQPAM